jgi:hypothetical protein
MTPKEKAEEVFLIFSKQGLHQISPFINRTIRKQIIKQCALIAVDEILKFTYSLKFGNALSDELYYWEEVKQEIEKL